MWSVLLGLTLFFATSTTVEDESNHGATHASGSHYPVIIIGAGPSGIAAAAELLRNNFSDFVILEASGRIGGRVYTAEFGDSIIEYGAQFVHGEKGNSVFQMASPHNILVSFIRRINNTYFYNSSGLMDKDVVVELLATCESITYDIDPSEFNGTAMDYLTKKYDAFISARGLDPVTASSVLELCVKYENLNVGTDTLAQIGLQEYTVGWDYEGSKAISWATNGYRTVFDLLTGKYPNPENELPLVNKTLLSKHVTAIDWSADKVRLDCEDGTTFTADYVIVTSSLGYLKKHYKTLFNPELPANKVAAIQSLGFGTVDKVFLMFSEAWWHNDTHCFELLWRDNDKEMYYNSTAYGKWPADFAGFYFVENQPRVLCGWIGGSAAREMETKNDTEVVNATMDLLRRFLGKDYRIPDPEAMTRSTWSTNPFVLGSYSSLSLASERLNVSAADLAAPLLKDSNTTGVLFAGEATHSHYFSTVHGAIDTGRREANRVLSLIRDKN